MAKNKIDTKRIGLDVGLVLAKWLTGKENLHYGLWDGLDTAAGNLLQAQEAYTDKLFGLLPEGTLRILDIGGGAGETAKKLLALGHSVDIVVPSPFLGERCAENAPDAKIHVCTFEEFETDETFDVCLFSESFQYIPFKESLPKCRTLLAEGGLILIADCFRSEAFKGRKESPVVGGGHRLSQFDAYIDAQGFTTEFREDVTASVAPSVDVSQGLENLIGFAVTEVNREFEEKRPFLGSLLRGGGKILLSKKRRDQLSQRLTGGERGSEQFNEFNRYLFLKLRP